MPRPRRDGAPAQAVRKRKLTELAVRKAKPERAAYLIWDSHQRGLALRVQPTGTRAWVVVYRHHGRPRWYYLGDADAIGLADARRLASRISLQVAEGKDPAAERKVERGAGTFAELAARYVEQYAKRKNRSWRHAERLVRRYVLPRWGKLQATTISRADVKALMGRIEAPVLCNTIVNATSAIFTWAVREEILPSNPARLVERNATTNRVRVLSDSELPRFWAAFDDAAPITAAALKTLLLCGQRPGEIAHMRREHVDGGWWQMPGKPELGWLGTKNGEAHRIWLSEPVR